MDAAPPRKSNTVLVVVAIVGGVLLVVVAIIGIMASLAIHGVRGYLTNAKTVTRSRARRATKYRATLDGQTIGSSSCQINMGRASKKSCRPIFTS